MAAPAFVNAATVLTDTTADASPITTSGYTVSASGHTLIISVGHERGSASEGSVLTISGITRNGQAASQIKRHTNPGAAAANEVGDVWQIQNAEVGAYPLVITYTGTGGSDISVIVAEYDGGTVNPANAVADYNGSADAAAAVVDVACPADSRLVCFQYVNTAGGTWGSPAYGTGRLQAANASGTNGNRQAVADYAVPSAGTQTGVCYNFDPYLSNWTNGPNIVIAFPLEAAAGASTGSLSKSIGDITLAATGEGDGAASEGALSASIGEITVAATGVGQQVTIEPDDEESDSYDLANTYVDGTTIYWRGKYDGEGLGGWVGGRFRASGGVPGQTYTVVCNAIDKQTPGAPNGNSASGIWSQCLYGKVGGAYGAPTLMGGYSYNSTTKEITNTFVWPVGATEIAITYKPTFTVSELDAFRQEIHASPYAIETNSSAAASSLPIGVHDRRDHGTGPNTVPAGTVDLWGVRIGTGAFVGLVVFCEHAQEDIGDLSAAQFIRWMLGASSEAATFRSRFSVYVYVHNLSGRKCGRTRYDQDLGTDEDPNRSWENSASEQTNALKAAIELDIPAASVKLAWLLAYHGQQDANINTAAFDIYTTAEFPADQQFYTRVAAAVGSQVHRQNQATAELQSGTSRKFGHIVRSAPLSLTLEHADAATGYPDAAAMFDVFAAATGETLIELADEGYFGRYGMVAAPIGDFGLDADGKLLIKGNANVSIGEITLDADGSQAAAPGTGSLTKSIGEITLDADGKLLIKGALNKTIGEIVSDADGRLLIKGGLSKSIGEIAIDAAGAGPGSGASEGSLSASIGEIDADAAGKLLIKGAGGGAIGTITVAATGGSVGLTVPTWLTLDRAGRSLTLKRGGRLAA